MICPVCKNQTSDGSKFCQVCGAPILQSDIRQNNNGQPHPQQQPRSDVGQQPRAVNNQSRPQQQLRPDWDKPHPQQTQAANGQQSRSMNDYSHQYQNRPMNANTQYNESMNNRDRPYYQRDSTSDRVGQQQDRHGSVEYDEYTNERQYNYGGGYDTPDIDGRLDDEDWQPYRIWLWLLLSYVTCGVSDIILMFKIRRDLTDITGSVRSSDTNITIVTVIWLICRVTLFIPLMVFGSLPRVAYAGVLGTSIQDAFDSLGERKNYALKYMGLAAYTIIPLPILAAADINHYAGYGKGSNKIVLGYILVSAALFLLYIVLLLVMVLAEASTGDSAAAAQVMYTLV